MTALPVYVKIKKAVPSKGQLFWVKKYLFLLFSGLSVLLVEFLNSSGSIKKFLLSGEEGV